MRYRLEKTDILSQKIWDDKEDSLLASFMPADFSLSFCVTEPEKIVNILNGEDMDEFDYRKAVKSLLFLCKSKDNTHNHLIETIEGLKEGGRALNFVLPKPVSNKEDCITSSELYKNQYSLAKKSWSAYYSRFYEKKPDENDYLVFRSHRRDLHHLLCVDGKWYVSIKFKGVLHKEYLGNDEDVAKKKRDQFLKRL